MRRGFVAGLFVLACVFAVLALVGLVVHDSNLVTAAAYFAVLCIVGGLAFR